MSLRNSKISATYTVHNQVKLIHGGREYFSEMKKMIREATQSIHLQTYIFDEDLTGESIAAELISACQRGVEVYMLLDGYASRNLTDGFIQRLIKAGVYFRFFEPVWKSKNFYFGRRLHHKVLVTDAQTALVGGVNISDKYNDLPDDPAWLDWAIHVKGDAAVVLFRICVSIWVKFPGEVKMVIRREKITPPDVSQHCHVRVRQNDWVTRKNEISRTYLEMFRGAQKEIIMMSSYFLPGRVFRHNMNRALRRGVKIKLILAGKSDIKIAKQAERYMYRWLFKNGVEIYEYPHNVLHGKIAVCDRTWVTGGSYNVNNISAFASIELNLDIRDHSFSDYVHQTLEGIIRNDCIECTALTYEIKYNFFQRVIQYASYEFVRLIFFLFTFYFRQR
jgi:cardiolipin synthase A/B